MATFTLRLDQLAQHVDVEPGAEIHLKGSVRSADGAIIDAASTTWPEGEGPASVDSGGLVDLKGGGFHLSSRDPATHEVVAIATGEDAPACAAAGVKAPCIALRTLPLSRTRLMTREELTQSLTGKISVETLGKPELPPPPPLQPVRDLVAQPAFQAAISVLLLALLASLAVLVQRRRKRSPRGQLEALIARVSSKLKTADAALAATLTPAVKKARALLDERRIDAASQEGQRVRDVLLRVELNLDETAQRTRAAKEQEAADELLIEVEAAVEAANEAMRR